MCICLRQRERKRDLPPAEAQFTMIVLASSTGSRLDFVSQSRVFFLQTFIWILCATVCKAEQYFNVEVRSAGCVCERVGFPLSLSSLPFFFFFLMSLKSNRQPAMSSSSQGIRLCRLSFQQPVASSPPRAAPPDGCVSAGDPVIPAARCRALERSPRETGNPHRARRKPGARYVRAAQERFAECLGLKIPLYCGVFPAFFGLVWMFFLFEE